MNILITELGRNKEETGLEDAQAGRHRRGVKVLDFDGSNVFVLVFDGDLEEIAFLALQEEEEGTLHLVHHSSDDEDTSVWPLERLATAWNRYTMLGAIHVSVDDVILTTNEHTRRTLKSFRRSHLTARNLYQ